MKISCLSINKATLNFSSFLEFIKSNINFIYLLTVLACGLIIGSAGTATSYGLTQLTDIIINRDYTYFQMFIVSLLCYLVVITLNFSMGLCCVGIPFISLLMLISGAISGAAILIGINIYIAQSDIITFIKLAVVLILFETVLIYSSDLSVKMSERVIKSMFFGIKSNEIIVEYLLRYFVILLVSIVLSLASSLILK